MNAHVLACHEHTDGAQIEDGTLCFKVDHVAVVGHCEPFGQGSL